MSLTPLQIAVNIDTLNKALAQLDPETDVDKIEGLQAQIEELHLLLDQSEVDDLDLDAIPEIPFTEMVERPTVTPVTEETDETPQDISKLATKIKTRPVEELLELADGYLAEEESLFDALKRAVIDYKVAQKNSDSYKSKHKDIIDGKSDVTYTATIVERTIRGLLARFAQQFVKIVETETEGLWDTIIENEDQLPEGCSFKAQYKIDPAPDPKKAEVIRDPEFIQWAIQWYPAILVIDADMATDYIKDLRIKSLKAMKKEELPEVMPPAKITPFILPTVGKIPYADLTGEVTYKIEFEKQGDVEPLFKIVSSASNRPIKSGLTYPEAKEQLEILQSDSTD